MANQLLYGLQGVREAGIVKLYGSFVTSTSGAVASSDCKGFTVAKTGTETGRYTVTLGQKYTKLRAASVMIEGSADTAYTTAKGVTAILRGVDVTTNGVLYIQFVDSDGSAADAELEDGAKVYIELTLKNTSAY